LDRGLSRRQVIAAARTLALGAILAPVSAPIAQPRRFRDDPFTLGVASGEPASDGFVIWTRFAPDPLNGGGLPPEAVPVQWEIATDERMRTVLQKGSATAHPELAHSVHVEVVGLEPDRPYWYRFTAGGQASPIGRSRTFPGRGAPADRLRLAWASCQHYGAGHFTPYRHLAADEIDLVLHLGDYVYAYARDDQVRPHPANAVTLEEYRNLHALYRTDADLQAAHAAFPWAVTWDDNDVENDYAGEHSAYAASTADFVRQRAAAYQAYYEHMPLRPGALQADGGVRLHRTLQFGDLAQLTLLDNRQFRDDQPCQTATKKAGRIVHDCAERLSGDRTMLGWEQEASLFGHLREPTGHWRVIAQQQLMASTVARDRAGRETAWSDGWDGYAATRDRLFGLIEDVRLDNVVVLSGDVHQYWATELRRDFMADGAPALATEFVTTSITSPTSDWPKHFRDRPYVSFVDWRYRGYARAEITPQQWRTDFRAVRSVSEPTAEAFTLASFTVDSGKAGAQAT